MNLENLCYALRSRESNSNVPIEIVCDKCHLPSYTCLNASLQMVKMMMIYITSVSFNIVCVSEGKR